MVKSTIDDIKDITLERQIRKLAGVIDKQNEVIDSVGNVDARITAVEDSTANNTVQINSVKEDVSKNTIAIGNISNRVTNVEQSTEAIPGIQTEINGINQSLVNNVTASFDNPSRTLMISLGREASPSIDATVVIPASSETGQYSSGNGITIQNYQIAVDTNVVALKTDIPVVPDVSGLTQRVQTLETEMPTKASVESVNSLEATVNSNTQNITTLTESVNGKVAIAQGTENAGKVLGIGADGNVTPVNAGGSSGGEIWEEINLQNWPTDWVDGDRVKVVIKQAFLYNQTVLSNIETRIITELYVSSSTTTAYTHNKPFFITPYCISGIKIGPIDRMNDGSRIFTIESWTFKDPQTSSHVDISASTLPNFLEKMWRLKKSQ